jgi:hypothetical protein
MESIILYSGTLNVKAGYFVTRVQNVSDSFEWPGCRRTFRRLS